MVIYMYTRIYPKQSYAHYIILRQRESESSDFTAFVQPAD